MPINKLTIASGTATTAGAQSGVAVGSITGDYTIKFFVESFPLPDAGARIAVEESVDDTFASPKQLWVFNFIGGSGAPVEGSLISFRKREAAGTDLLGTAGAYLRLNVQELNGTVGLVSISYDCWIEY